MKSLPPCCRCAKGRSSKGRLGKAGGSASLPAQAGLFSPGRQLGTRLNLPPAKPLCPHYCLHRCCFLCSAAVPSHRLGHLPRRAGAAGRAPEAGERAGKTLQRRLLPLVPIAAERASQLWLFALPALPCLRRCKPRSLPHLALPCPALPPSPPHAAASPSLGCSCTGRCWSGRAQKWASGWSQPTPSLEPRWASRPWRQWRSTCRCARAGGCEGWQGQDALCSCHCVCMRRPALHGAERLLTAGLRAFLHPEPLPCTAGVHSRM